MITREKVALEISKSEWEAALKRDEKNLAEMRKAVTDLKAGKEVENLTLSGAQSVVKGLEEVIRNKKRMISKLAVEAFEQVLTAKVHPSQKARNKYLREHPKADPSHHTVEKKEVRKRPKREKEYQVARLEDQIKKIEKAISEDSERLEKATKKEKAELQKDIKRMKRNVEELQQRIKALKPQKEASVFAEAVRLAMEFPTEEARKKYLQEHPKADPKKHTVKKEEPTDKKFEPSQKHKDLGGEIQQWQGPGTPAINEVGSHLSAGKAFPHKRLEEAAKEFEGLPADNKEDEKLRDSLVKQLRQLSGPEKKKPEEKPKKPEKDEGKKPKDDPLAPMAGYGYEHRAKDLKAPYEHLMHTVSLATYSEKQASSNPRVAFEETLKISKLMSELAEEITTKIINNEVRHVRDLRVPPYDLGLSAAQGIFQAADIALNAGPKGVLLAPAKGQVGARYTRPTPWLYNKVDEILDKLERSRVREWAIHKRASFGKTARTELGKAKETSMGNPRKAFEEALGKVRDDQEDFYLTAEEVADICLPCAKKMIDLRVDKIAASEVFADKWEKMPKGWTDESRKKFWKSVGGDVKKCMKKMEGKVSDTGAFCAALKDRIEGTTFWRGPEKTAFNPREAFEQALGLGKAAAAGPYTLLKDLERDVRSRRIMDPEVLERWGFAMGHTRGADYIVGAGQDIVYALIHLEMGKIGPDEALRIINRNLRQALKDNLVFEGMRAENSHDTWMALHKSASETSFTQIVREAIEKTAIVFPTEEARKKYLQKHPKADPKRHTVKKQEPSKVKEEGKPKEKGKADDQPKGKGSGLGSLKKGNPVTKLEDVKDGQLLVQENKERGTVNVVRVTKVKGKPSPGFEGHFVNPNNPEEKRMPEDMTFHVWGDDLKKGEYSAVGEDKKEEKPKEEKPKAKKTRRGKPKTHELAKGTKIRVYDNGGETADRYTVIVDGKDWDASVNPGYKMSLGFGAGRGGGSISQWGEAKEGKHLGKGVDWEDLDKDAKDHIKQRVLEED